MVFDGFRWIFGTFSADSPWRQEVWHPSGRLYCLSRGQVYDGDQAMFFESVAKRDRSEHLVEHDRLVRRGSRPSV